MKQTLKIVNNNKEIEVVLPVSGMLGTMFVGSDRYAVVCTKVSSNKRCELVVFYDFDDIDKEDLIIDEDGIEYLSEKAMYKHNLINVFNSVKYSLRKNGLWYESGTTTKRGCCGVIFGKANPYIDPNF